MPRPPRLLLSKSYYHVMTRGNNRMKIFHEPADYQRYLELIARFKDDHQFDLFHYCLMPNHVHQLIQTKNAEDFAVFMKRLNLAYFHHYRKKYGWVGHFWQDRYKSQPVGKDSYFLQLGKYIELNAPRAGLVKLAEEWPWSSYQTYALGKPNTILTEDMFYIGLGNTPEQRQRIYSDLIIEDLIRQTNKLPVWGSTSQRYLEQRKIKRNLKSRISR